MKVLIVCFMVAMISACSIISAVGTVVETAVDVVTYPFRDTD